jgi:hypothetical protein
MASISGTSSLTSLSDMIHFGLLEFSTSLRVGLWELSIFTPF